MWQQGESHDRADELPSSQAIRSTAFHNALANSLEQLKKGQLSLDNLITLVDKHESECFMRNPDDKQENVFHYLCYTKIKSEADYLKFEEFFEKIFAKAEVEGNLELLFERKDYNAPLYKTNPASDSKRPRATPLQLAVYLGNLSYARLIVRKMPKHKIEFKLSDLTILSNFTQIEATKNQFRQNRKLYNYFVITEILTNFDFLATVSSQQANENNKNVWSEIITFIEGLLTKGLVDKSLNRNTARLPFYSNYPTTEGLPLEQILKSVINEETGAVVEELLAASMRQMDVSDTAEEISSAASYFTLFSFEEYEEAILFALQNLDFRVKDIFNLLIKNVEKAAFLLVNSKTLLFTLFAHLRPASLEILRILLNWLTESEFIRALEIQDAQKSTVWHLLIAAMQDEEKVLLALPHIQLMVEVIPDVCKISIPPEGRDLLFHLIKAKCKNETLLPYLFEVMSHSRSPIEVQAEAKNRGIDIAELLKSPEQKALEELQKGYQYLLARLADSEEKIKHEKKARQELEESINAKFAENKSEQAKWMQEFAESRNELGQNLTTLRQEMMTNREEVAVKLAKGDETLQVLSTNYTSLSTSLKRTPSKGTPKRSSSNSDTPNKRVKSFDFISDDSSFIQAKESKQFAIYVEPVEAAKLHIDHTKNNNNAQPLLTQPSNPLHEEKNNVSNIVGLWGEETAYQFLANKYQEKYGCLGAISNEGILKGWHKKAGAEITIKIEFPNKGQYQKYRQGENIKPEKLEYDLIITKTLGSTATLPEKWKENIEPEKWKENTKKIILEVKSTQNAQATLTQFTPSECKNFANRNYRVLRFYNAGQTSVFFKKHKNILEEITKGNFPVFFDM